MKCTGDKKKTYPCAQTKATLLGKRDILRRAECPTAGSRAVVCFVESLASPLELLVHGQQVLDSGELTGVLADEEDDVLHLHAALASDGHGLVRHFRDELDHQVLQDVHRLRVRVLVVPETVHHAPELLGEEPLPAAVAHVRAGASLLHLLVEAGLVLFVRHSVGAGETHRLLSPMQLPTQSHTEHGVPFGPS